VVAFSASGTLKVTNSTLSGNTANGGSGCTTICIGAGGGIESDGALTLINSTLSDNSADAGSSCTGTTGPVGNCRTLGGGIYIGGTAKVGAIIVANSTGGDCFVGSPFTDLGYNLEDDAADTCGFSATDNDIVGQSPDLGPLQNNGGSDRDRGHRLHEPRRLPRGYGLPFDRPAW